MSVSSPPYLWVLPKPLSKCCWSSHYQNSLNPVAPGSPLLASLGHVGKPSISWMPSKEKQMYHTHLTLNTLQPVSSALDSELLSVLQSNYILNFAKMLFNFLHLSSLNIAYLPTRQIPETHTLSSALGTWNIHTGSNSQPVQPSFATHWAGPLAMSPEHCRVGLEILGSGHGTHHGGSHLPLSSASTALCFSNRAWRSSRIQEGKSKKKWNTSLPYITSWAFGATGHFFPPLPWSGNARASHSTHQARVAEGRHCEAIKMQNLYVFSTWL